MKLNLRQMYVYGGKRFGPGETELPDGSDVLKALAAREGVKLGGEPAAPVKRPAPSVVGEPHFGGKPLSYFDGKGDEDILSDPDVRVGKKILADIRDAQKAAAK